MSGSSLLLIETDWNVPLFQMKHGGGVGFYQITTGVATDEDDFIIGGTGGLGIAPANGDIGSLAQSYSITRGRSSELDRPTAGTATIVLDSPSAVFSPLNISGCLSGSLLPRRSLSISWRYEPATGAASKFQRFTGRITRITPEPNVLGGRQVVITAIDDFNEMQRLETRSTLYQDVKSGCLAGSILDNAGYFTTCRVIADGQDVYNYAYFEGRKLDEVLVDIERTEYGFMYVRGDGALVFHDRHYRSTTLAVSASFIDTMSDIKFSRNDDNLSTEAEVPYNPKVIKASTIVWTLLDQMSIPASGKVSFFGNYLDPTTCRLVPAFGVASPIFGVATAPAACFYSTSVASLGVNVNTDMSASLVVFAESFKFTASNGGSAKNWLTGMTITGCPLVGYEESTARAQDTTACAQYGLRTLTYGGQNLIHTSEKAQAFAQFLVNRFKDPTSQDLTSVTIRPKNDTLWEQILRREIDDRVAISNNVLGINEQDFFIGKLNEAWSTGMPVEVTWDLEKATTQNDFVIDYSEFDSSDTIGY